MIQKLADELNTSPQVVIATFIILIIACSTVRGRHVTQRPVARCKHRTLCLARGARQSSKG